MSTPVVRSGRASAVGIRGFIAVGTLMSGREWGGSGEHGVAVFHEDECVVLFFWTLSLDEGRDIFLSLGVYVDVNNTNSRLVCGILLMAHHHCVDFKGFVRLRVSEREAHSLS